MAASSRAPPVLSAEAYAGVRTQFTAPEAVRPRGINTQPHSLETPLLLDSISPRPHSTTQSNQTILSSNAGH